MQAFAREFRQEDNVELVIKTFANPHNHIADDIEAARSAYPNAAPIRLITDHLSSEDLSDLVASAELLVAPSRGEGFGLPLAEAMLLDTPVATTAYSGQLDFCTPDTAWLFDYHLVPSAAHVSGSGGVWAEPSLESLQKTMRQALAQKTLSQQKTRRAKQLLAAHFKWRDVAHRVGSAIAVVEQAQTRMSFGPSLPPIALVSTWEQICGIATYAHHLFETPALSPTLNRVLAREISGDALPLTLSNEPRHLRLDRPWGYDRRGVEQLAALLREDASPILWVQHHPGFFSGADMALLVASARARQPNRPILVTLHNSQAALASGDVDWLRKVDLVFVHTAEDAQNISMRVPKADVRVIPHGIVEPESHAMPDPDYVTIGSFGFLFPHKNVPKLLIGFAKAFAYAPHLKLKLLNCVRATSDSMRERRVVERLIEELGIAEAVEFSHGFLPDEEVINALQQCDILCFSYGDSDESASGAVRIALAADRPILCSKSSVLRDIQDCALKLDAIKPETIAEALLITAASPEIRHALDQKRRKFVGWHRYERIANRYAQTIQDYLSQ